MREVILASAFCLVLGCAKSPQKRLAPNAEALDNRKSSAYRVQENDLTVVLRERQGRDDVTLIAIQQRQLTRNELRAVARRLAGKAKVPTIDFYASQDAYAACVRGDYSSLRGQANSADDLKCSRGTVFRMDRAEPRVLYWGKAARE
jgi:hypothetical protein